MERHMVNLPKSKSLQMQYERHKISCNSIEEGKDSCRKQHVTFKVNEEFWRVTLCGVHTEHAYVQRGSQSILGRESSVSKGKKAEQSTACSEHRAIVLRKTQSGRQDTVHLQFQKGPSGYCWWTVHQKHLKENTLLSKDNGIKHSIDSDNKLGKHFAWIFCFITSNLRNSSWDL